MFGRGRLTIIPLLILLLLSSTITLSPEIGAGKAAPIFRIFYPSDDSYVSGCCPTANYGELDRITVGVGPSQRDFRRSFIKFNNLSTIPPGSIIESAFLYLFLFESPSLRSRLYCHTVDRNWTESKITWSNQPGAVKLIGNETIPTVPRWIIFNVTKSVSEFVSKDSATYLPNYGWRLSDWMEGESSEEFSYSFCSKENNVTGERPFLEVKYYPPHLELKVQDDVVWSGKWVKMIVYRKTFKKEPITRGSIQVILRTSSKTGRFSLNKGGEPISFLTIHDGSDFVEFWYYDETVGTSVISASTEQYPLYGVGTTSITIMSKPPDVTPPVTTIDIGTPKHEKNGLLYVSESTIFTLFSTDDDSGVFETTYRIDNGSWTTYNVGFSLRGCSEGLHKVEYYSVDSSGNEEDVKIIQAYLDSSPPLVRDASPSGNITQDSKTIMFTVRVEDKDSGVKEVKLIVDGSDKGAMTSDGDVYTMTLSLEEGSHTWSIEAVDNVGNSITQNYSLMIKISAAPSSTWVYATIAIIAVVIMVAIALVLRKRRR
jgi:hypothetical protein